MAGLDKMGNSSLEVKGKGGSGQRWGLDGTCRCTWALRAPADIRCLYPLASWWPMALGVRAMVGSSPRRDFPPLGHKVGCQLGPGMRYRETGQPNPKTKKKHQPDLPPEHDHDWTSTILDAIGNLKLSPNFTHQCKGKGLLNLKHPSRLGPPRQCTCCSLDDLVQ